LGPRTKWFLGRAKKRKKKNLLGSNDENERGEAHSPSIKRKKKKKTMKVLGKTSARKRQKLNEKIKKEGSITRPIISKSKKKED